MKMVLIPNPKFGLMCPKNFDKSREEVIMVEGFEGVGLKGPSLFSVKVNLPLFGKESPEECRPANLILGLKKRVIGVCGVSGYSGIVI